jgi:concanavalin A-like lectin/glucanase superfamily protein
MCKKLFVRASRASDFRSVIPTSRVLWLVAFAVVWTMIGYGGTAIGQVVGVDDPSDMADSSGDIKRIEAWVDEGNLNLTMTVYGVFAPSVEDTARGMTNRYYCHWLLDTDNNPDTGFSNSEYEGSATNLQTPIGADVVVQFGWRDGSTNGVNAYDPLTEDSLLEDYEYTIDGDTIHAVIPLADLGLTADDTIAVSAFQEGASGDWQVDWVESVVLPLRVVESVEPVNPGDAGLVLYYDFENDVNDMSGNGNDGVLLGDANVMDGLLVLDGDDDAVAIARIGGDEAVYSQISYGMWIYPTADLTGLEFSGGMNTSPWSAGAVHMKANNGVINVGISGLDGGDLVGTTIIDPNTWSHMALTISETNVSLYLNGQLEDSRDLAAPLADLILGSATLGGWENGDVQREMAGFMDDVVVYDRGLSANEVQWLAGLRPIAVDPGSEGLAAYYSLDNDANDISGNGLDGTIMGDPELIAGAMGGAMEFDGDGDYIDCGNDASLDIPGPISLALWIRPDADDPEGNVTETAPMCKASSSASPSWSWQVRYGWNSPQPYMAFTFNTSPRAWAYVGQNLEQGEWAHIACSHDGETLTAYLNGTATESTPMGAIASSPAPILIGQDGWNSDWIGGIDEVMVYNRALSGGEIMFLAGYMPDVTALGDAVQGDPNDGDWPGAETPDLAIDDDTATKYLHFKGFSQSTGIQVTPAVGATIVTGLTFTTANDAVERDPVAFELLGSNDGIDGSYTLIASGDIVDFAQDEAWPRFTKNETPIVFNNTVAYTTYKILITAVRDAASANSMQIAEIELAGIAVD